LQTKIVFSYFLDIPYQARRTLGLARFFTFLLHQNNFLFYKNSIMGVLDGQFVTNWRFL